ncbi:hypothetical protein K7432_004688 [Basidiobolus ranarum]|uniref:C3H1-type domain-containing protein n=1 Tax=Basidiobolus ranarum TaxID=34480 RepID=A0ABR2WXU5_9FUNG
MVYSSVFDMNATRNKVTTNQQFGQMRLTSDEIQLPFIPNLEDVFADLSLWRSEYRGVITKGPSQQLPSTNHKFDAKEFYSNPPQLNQIKQNVKDVALYKTEMCRSFEETGSCRYGEKCQFAHGASDLRVVKRHPRYKTQYCRTYWEQGCCPYGKRSCFIHSEEEISGLDSQSSRSQQCSSPVPSITAEDLPSTSHRKNLKAEWVKTSKVIGHSWEETSITSYPVDFQLFSGPNGSRSQPVARPIIKPSFLHKEWTPFSGFEQPRKLTTPTANQEVPERLSAFTQFF